MKVRRRRKRKGTEGHERPLDSYICLDPTGIGEQLKPLEKETLSAVLFVRSHVSIRTEM